MVQLTKTGSKKPSTPILFKGRQIRGGTALIGAVSTALTQAAIFCCLCANVAWAQDPSINKKSAEVDITMLTAGRAMFDQRRFPEAFQDFCKFRDQRPNNLAVHFWMATTLSAMGRDKEAVTEYVSCLNLAASINMDSPEMRSNMGTVLVRSGYTKEPIFDYKRACVIDSRCPAPYLGVAKCLVDSGNFDEALNALDAYKKTGGIDINAILLHGLALAGQDQYEPARRDLQTFLNAANQQRSTGNYPPLDQALASSTTKYLTTGGTSQSAIDLANRILSQLPSN